MAQMASSPTESVCTEAEEVAVERVGFHLPGRGFVVLRLRSVDGGRVIDIYQAEAILGRHSQADIRVAAPDVSRHHCRLRFESGHWYVEDLGSLNGTYVDGELVQRARLTRGCVLRVASHAFTVDWPQFDSTVDCPVALSAELSDERARHILESIAEQLPD
jgi:pSer/pThr/pTyr-binding forkhead associated (FHA) protein